MHPGLTSWAEIVSALAPRSMLSSVAHMPRKGEGSGPAGAPRGYAGRARTAVCWWKHGHPLSGIAGRRASRDGFLGPRCPVCLRPRARARPLTGGLGPGPSCVSRPPCSLFAPWILFEDRRQRSELGSAARGRTWTIRTKITFPGLPGAVSRRPRVVFPLVVAGFARLDVAGLYRGVLAGLLPDLLPRSLPRPGGPARRVPRRARW